MNCAFFLYSLHCFLSYFAHKLSNSIAKRYDIVIFEDLNVKAMQQFNGKMVGDNIMGTIIPLTKYKVEERGGLVYQIGRFVKSTGICKSCHHKHNLSLKERNFVCENCGSHNDRDHASANNIMQTGITDLIAAGNVVRVKQPNACDKIGVKTNVFARKVSKLPKESKKKETLIMEGVFHLIA